MLDSGVTFAGAWVPQGTYIAQIVAVAHVHIWAPGQVLGIRAQLQGTGLSSPPHSPLCLWRGNGEGGGDWSTLLTRGMQAHFPWGDRTAFISRMASLGLLPVYLNATARAVSLCGALSLCAVILGGLLLSILLIDWNVMPCVPNQLANRLGLRWGSCQFKLVLEGLRHWKIQMRDFNYVCMQRCVCVLSILFNVLMEGLDVCDPKQCI